MSYFDLFFADVLVCFYQRGDITEQTIYGDIYFLINFSMDFLCLYLVSAILHTKVGTVRLSLAAAVGAAYALAALLPFRSLPLRLLSDLLTPFTVCLIAFGFGKPTLFIKRTALFFAVSFTSGGVMTALYYFANKFLKSREIVINGSVETVYSEIPLWVFALCAALCALLSVIWSRISAKAVKTAVARVGVISPTGKHEFDALVDSGNLLTDPLGGLPVIIAEKSLAVEIMPTEIGRLALSFSLSPAETESIGKSLRLIPYKSISGSGLAVGYIPESITVNGNKVAAVIASINEDGRDFSGYRAIVPSALL